MVMARLIVRCAVSSQKCRVKIADPTSLTHGYIQTKRPILHKSGSAVVYAYRQNFHMSVRAATRLADNDIAIGCTLSALALSYSSMYLYISLLMTIEHLHFFCVFRRGVVFHVWEVGVISALLRTINCHPIRAFSSDKRTPLFSVGAICGICIRL